MKALVVGGAGITGTRIVRGLMERDYDVTILHRGVHEPDLPETVKRIHANPYDKVTLPDALEGHEFDLAIVTYGRLRYVMKALQGKTGRLISVGGAAPIYKGWGDMMATNPWETTSPTPMFLEENHPLSCAETENQFSMAVRHTENEVMQAHTDGHFNVTHFRYPLVYGPQNLCPAEWGLIRRAREGRVPLIMPGRGLTMISRGYADNVAHGVLLAVDQPDNSAGEIFNICDDQLLFNHQWVNMMEEILDHRFEKIDIPFAWLPEGFRATPPQLLYRDHCVVSIDKLKTKLGYRDIVKPQQALEETVRWYMDNPLEPESEPEQNLGDPFDYAYEDGVIAAFEKGLSVFNEGEAALPRAKVVWKHPYQ
jgi:nucleoside-diphosphate-sugar epimerase